MDGATHHPLAPLIHLIPTLTWCVIAFYAWYLTQGYRRHSSLYFLVSMVSTLFALHYGLHVVQELVPTNLGGRVPHLQHILIAGINVPLVLSIAMLLHLVRLAPRAPVRISRRWLALNYGIAAIMIAVGVVVAFRPDTLWVLAEVFSIYTIGALLMGFMLMLRNTRRGGWRQGSGLLEFRTPDVVILAIAGVSAGLMVAVAILTGLPTGSGSMGGLLLHTFVGMAFAAPFAARMLGRVLPAALVIAMTLGTALALYFGGHALAARASHPEIAHLLNLAAVAALLLLIPAQPWLRRSIDRLLFRHARIRQAELQEIVRGLSAELSPIECCRRVCAGLLEVMHFKGVGILLARGEVASAGDIRVKEIERAWPQAPPPALLNDRPLDELDLRDLPTPLKEALVETDVVHILPIRSPARRWGHLLAAETLLAAPLRDSDEEAIAAFLDQLALVLDASELLARAVEVERSLAHSEKLAAVGELAARIAHEIRNPITAARSLAQQLAREPGAVHGAEHTLILEELERVEKRVAELLRFSRRDEFRLAEEDLGKVIRGTVADLAPALASHGIEVAVHLEDGLRGRVDHDKLRQVLVNLLENARDALCTGNGERRVTVDLERHNGRALVRVTDSGPGIAKDDLPHLFEPFFSRKPDGTGLGLAIVRRTVEAHGGRITATPGQERGMRFEIDLPLTSTPRERG
jgi:signal transduction histidine kinase